jgi:hypothetical protein
MKADRFYLSAFIFCVSVVFNYFEIRFRGRNYYRFQVNEGQTVMTTGASLSSPVEFILFSLMIKKPPGFSKLKKKE